MDKRRVKRQIKEVRNLFLDFDIYGWGDDVPDDEYDDIVLYVVGLQRFHSDFQTFRGAFREMWPNASDYEEIDSWAGQVWARLTN